jgi:hypothetical protein
LTSEAAAYAAAYAYAFGSTAGVANFSASLEYFAVHETYTGNTTGTTYVFTHDASGTAVAVDAAGNLASGDIVHAFTVNIG